MPAEISVGTDGNVSSVTYGDVYHSRSGALAQARHVFLAGNGLLGKSPRWQGRECFTILETGFGAGINFLTTWLAWREAGGSGRLHYVAVEKHPVSHAALVSILASQPSLQAQAHCLTAQWPLAISGLHRLHFDNDRVTLTLAFGDIMAMLPQLDVKADALYLDGFSPAKNPEMWSARVLGAVTRLCKNQATLATWCVAGEVRRQLGFRGWALERIPGFGGKHQMLRGILSRPDSAVSPAPTSRDREAVVVGAGLAGCSVSERLCARGWRVTLIDRQHSAAGEASGNPSGILLPRMALDDALAARLARSAFFYTLHTLQRLGDTINWDACGVLHMSADAADERYQRQVIERLRLPEEFIAFLETDAARDVTGLPLKRGGWWFPTGGWVAPASYCLGLIAQAGQHLTTRYDSGISRLRREDGQWQVLDAEDHVVAQAPHLILANAQGANTLLIDWGEPLPLEAIRGQVSYMPDGTLINARSVVCGAAYVTPAAGQFACVGATFDRNDTDLHVRQKDHSRNLAMLASMLDEPSGLQGIPHAHLEGRTGFRCMSRDKLPIVGTLPSPCQSGMHATTLAAMPRIEGLHTLVGLGARGLLWAPLMAEMLASQLNDEPMPVTRTMVDAVDPARFQLRAQRGIDGSATSR